MEECPDKLDNVEFVTVRDNYKAGASGSQIDGKPKAWISAIKLLDNWKYDDTDLGRPADWGPDCILIVDSLSRLCDAAYDFHESIIPRGKSGDYDGRAVYGNAQDDVEKVLAMLTSRSFATNLIVIAHGTYMDLPDGTTKIFPQGVGQKLSPKIPQYFPSYIRYKNKGGKRTIQTTSDAMIDLANPDNWGKPVEIAGTDITMQGVNQPLLGISDTGDTKLMEPGKNYKFKGKKVTEFPIAKNGINNLNTKPLQKLEDLTNFTNYNQDKGWLNKYN